MGALWYARHHKRALSVGAVSRWVIAVPLIAIGIFATDMSIFVVGNLPTSIGQAMSTDAFLAMIIVCATILNLATVQVAAHVIR
jgi:hypothetical protein